MPNSQVSQGGGARKESIFDDSILTITLSIFVRLFFFKCQKKALDEIYPITPFLGQSDKNIIPKYLFEPIMPPVGWRLRETGSEQSNARNWI